MNNRTPANQKGYGWVIAQLHLMAICAVAGWLWNGQWPTGQYDWAIPALLAVLGAVIGIAGIWVLGRNRTVFPQPRPNSVLITHGIYRHLRHPLYSSVLCAAFAWGLWRHSLAALGAALVLTLFLALKARNEEARLLHHFPGYAAYQARTSRFLPWFF